MKKGCMPVLRFPEFREAGEWATDELGGKTVKVGSGITPTGGDKKYKTFGRPFVRSQNIGWGTLILEDVAYIDETTHSTFLGTEIVEGDVLLNITGASIGRSAVADNRINGGNVNQHVCIIRTKPDELIPFFLNQFLLSENGQSQIDSFQAGGNRQGLNFAQIRSFLIPLPPIRQEQQKIAACLSSLDELITAQAQKVEALKIHKKGLMQQLFPAEDETVPKLRFPEFQEAGEWEEKPLNKISTSIFDGTHQTPIYTEEGIPFFSVENIVSGKLNKFISREDYLISTSKNTPEKGDILITRIGNIGFSAIVNWEYEFSIYVTLAVVKKTDQFDSYYLHCFFQSERYQTEIRSKSLLNAVPCKINMDELRKTKILLPSLKEQQKIAACLSSLDELITAQAQKLDALKAHKKGLMQQLFPLNELGDD